MDLEMFNIVEKNTKCVFDIKLGKPQNGWLTVMLMDDKHSFTIDASYLTDVPYDLLQCAIQFIETRSAVSFELDGEGKGVFVVVLAPYDSTAYIVHDALKTKSFNMINYTPVMFGKMIYEWVLEYQDYIYDWNLDVNMKKDYVKQIDKLVSKLRNLLKECGIIVY